ncbi:RNA-directed DNA polymerase, eukaryota [Tanacetum coccineum]|uniref:RNA-directed DNA polymerase, eukaryota n=1 Tax=Tanacetum coccineum TaxID=301880 RepID=A0ABQ5ADV1_9ASTR
MMELLRDTSDVSVEEGLAMSLRILCHGTRQRIIADRFQHSTGTVHRWFKIVLRALKAFAVTVVKSVDRGEVQPEIRADSRWYPFFKNCIGAIDGTHVSAWAPTSKQKSFRGRKAVLVTQNVMAICSHDMMFTFVYPCWEGTANDSRVFYDAIIRPENNGYPNLKGFLAPYRGERYHRSDWQRGGVRGVSGKRELFNFMHFSVRNVIERAFGVHKARFHILKDIPCYPLRRQMLIPHACCALHNYIRMEDRADNLFTIYGEDYLEVPGESSIVVQEGLDLDLTDNVEMLHVRDSIANDLWDKFNSPLIPKFLEPKFVGDFRPISLIGRVYKVITKILQSRVSLVISDLISDIQTAFLPNRQILDGPFIINELLSRCHHKKQSAMIFKVDFAKAYDSIRWDYLEDVLFSFGFGSKWRSWIRGCLTSSMASILISGSPTSEFQFHRGLKQGDHLAPYLFILVMESLHLSFSRVIDAGIFTGIRIDPTTMISHLFYADDAVFIGEWSQENLNGIMQMLRCFSLLSGLSINIKKSHILGVGIPSSLVNEAASRLGCSVMKVPFKYLGITVGGNTSLVKSWDDTIYKLKSRLSKWKLKTLSIGGRFTLLKSVLGSTPIYNMSLYKVPKAVLNTMESIRRNFFNGIQENEKKIAWIKWTKVLAPKKHGGLGVSSFYALNRALLFKWMWRFLSRDNSLWFRTILAIHGPGPSHSASKGPLRSHHEIHPPSLLFKWMWRFPSHRGSLPLVFVHSQAIHGPIMVQNCNEARGCALDLVILSHLVSKCSRRPLGTYFVLLLGFGDKGRAARLVARCGT